MFKGAPTMTKFKFDWDIAFIVSSKFLYLALEPTKIAYDSAGNGRFLDGCSEGNK